MRSVSNSVACLVFATALTIQPATGSANAQTADSRLDDRLLSWVGKQQLRDSDFRCVRQMVPASKIEFREVSPWLLQQLQQVQPTLRHCGPADTTYDPVRTELWLGPIAWRQPAREANVYFGFPDELLGQQAYIARRGRFGRWHFTPMVRE
jgi:hypothetical protein